MRWLLVALLTPAAGAGTQTLSVEDGIARGRALEARGDAESALALYGEVVSGHPEDWRGFMLRGSLSFRLGDNEGSLADFDRVVALSPEQEPYLWQRGIAQYYASNYEACARQFELHRTVNGADVENSVWHFLCHAKTDGLAAARSGLLPVGADPRVPMQEVYDLFAGTVTVEDVLAAARGARSRPALALFYAELYLGLYLEAIGEPERGREYLESAARAQTGGYMRDVARVHVERSEDGSRD